MTLFFLITFLSLHLFLNAHGFSIPLTPSSFHKTKPQESIKPPLKPLRGNHYLKFSLGTPPIEMVAVADTGSSLLWIQCLPCLNCIRHMVPIFDPLQSSSYGTVWCPSDACDKGRSTGASCNDNTKVCEYSIIYGDKTFSKGNMAYETLGLISSSNISVAFPSKLFGCGHNNNVPLHGNGTGIVGLGRGPLSLISQLEPTVQGRFSYCLLPYDSHSTSWLNFGEDAFVSGEGTQVTPLVPDPDFYYVMLEGISVGESILVTSQDGTSNTPPIKLMIDSGSTLISLSNPLYTKFQSLIADSIPYPPIQSPQAPYTLCYELPKSAVETPPVTFHFRKADFYLKSENLLVYVADNYTCLAMQPNENWAILGNVAQTNFHIAYDIPNEILTFKAEDCSKI